MLWFNVATLDVTLALQGIRNSESSPVFFGGSEILKPFLVFFGGSEILNPFWCSLGDQKFWTFSSFLWEIRNSEPFLMFFGGSEILNPLLCCLGDQKFWIVFYGGTSRDKKFKNRLVSYAWLKHYISVQIKNRKLLGRIFSFLANWETFPLSFKTSLRFLVYCKNCLWN